MGKQVVKEKRVYTAFDRALSVASKNSSPVTFHYLGMEDDIITATPISVGEDFIEIEMGNGDKVWLNKEMIALVRIEK